MAVILAILAFAIGTSASADDIVIDTTDLLAVLPVGARICTSANLGLGVRDGAGRPLTVFGVSLEGVPHNATAVLYTVTPAGSEPATHPVAENHIAVLSIASGIWRSEADIVLGRGVGSCDTCRLEIYAPRAQGGRPVMVVSCWRGSSRVVVGIQGMEEGGFTEILAWKPSHFVPVMNFYKHDRINDFYIDQETYAYKVRETTRGDVALVLQCLRQSQSTHLPGRMPIVYAIKDGRASFANQDNPELFEPYVHGVGALAPGAPGANYIDSLDNPVRALIYQRRYGKARSRIKDWMKHAERLGERGQELKAHVHRVWAELLIAQGKYAEGEEQFLHAAMATNLGEHFRRYAVMQSIRLGEDDPELSKLFSTHPDEQERWRQSLWKAYLPPPADDRDRAQALIMAAEHYARIADYWQASGAYRRALSPIEGEADREIRTWHLKNTTTPPPVPLDQIPQYKRQKTAPIIARIERLNRLLTP